MAVSEPERHYDAAPRKAVATTVVAPAVVVVAVKSRDAMPETGRFLTTSPG